MLPLALEPENARASDIARLPPKCWPVLVLGNDSCSSPTSSNSDWSTSASMSASIVREVIRVVRWVARRGANALMAAAVPARADGWQAPVGVEPTQSVACGGAAAHRAGARARHGTA